MKSLSKLRMLREQKTKRERGLSAEELIEFHNERIREIRQNPEALSDLPIELFMRLVGLFNTIPERKREIKKYQDNCKEFEKLKRYIDNELVGIDGKNFAKFEMGDYVHNLHLLLIGVLPLEHLEANIENIRREYQDHVDDLTYKTFINSELHIYVDKYSKHSQRDPEFNRDAYEDNLRAEYKNLVNENRRAKLLEQHIETTRSYLIKQVSYSFFKLTILPVAILLSYAYLTWLVDYYGEHSSVTMIAEIYKTWKSPDQGNYDLWFNGFAIVAIFSLAAIAGATGALLSVLLRIQGVRDNNQLAQNLVAFKYSVNAVKAAPLLGMIFALVLSLLFAANIIGGSVFPAAEGHTLRSIIFNFTAVSKWIIWGFIAGFSERLVPDMVDRIAEKARKAESG